jgi:hypothetical protein
MGKTDKQDSLIDPDTSRSSFLLMARATACTCSSETAQFSDDTRR